MTELELLRATRWRLVEKGWKQNALGESNGPSCLEGALTYSHLAAGDYDIRRYRSVRHALDERIPADFAGFTTWNDTPDRTLSEVLALLDDEIAAREEHEGVEPKPEPEPIREPVLA